MKTKKIRIGLIGCGGFMRYYHLPQLVKNRHVELAGVADPDQSQIDALLQKADSAAPGYADYKEMIRRENLDGVFISTPHSFHYEQVQFALNHGLHVLVQKPITIRSDHAAKLVALAEKQSRFLMVSYQRFYDAQSVYARELVARGEIGEIRAVSCYITQKWSISGWRIVPALSGGGFMMDTGSHVVSSMLRITGLHAAEVSMVAENYGNAVDLSSIMTIRFSNGALGSLSFFGQTERHDECLSIHGSKGCIVLRGHQWKVKPLLVNDEPVTIPARLKPATPDSTFIDWIRNGGKGYTPPRIAVDTIKLTEAAYRSVRESKPIRIRL